MPEVNLMLGDCLEKMRGLVDESVDLVITDPPFGCNATQKGVYNDDEEYIEPLIEVWLNEISRLMKDTSVIYLYVPTKYIENWIVPFKRIFKLYNILACVNMKKGTGYDNAFRNNYQMILYGSKGRAKNFNKVDWILTSDVWFYDKRNEKPTRYIYEYPSFIPPYYKATVEENSGHPDEKNVELISRFIEISSNEKDIVFDPFMGSGSTGVAAKSTNRDFIGIEINEEYFTIAKNRMDVIKAQSKLSAFE